MKWRWRPFWASASTSRISRINAAVLDRRPGLSASIEELLEADSHARALAQGEVAALAP